MKVKNMKEKPEAKKTADRNLYSIKDVGSSLKEGESLMETICTILKIKTTTSLNVIVYCENCRALQNKHWQHCLVCGSISATKTDTIKK